MALTTTAHSIEVATGKRFAFGNNWTRFLTVLDDDRISQAETTLIRMFEVSNLNNKTFLDVGSGSGLFSLAARRLGAKVFSFDYDPQSVACTAELKRRYFTDDQSWIVEQGSALDKEYLQKLGKFDMVYSWGVLHHTGAMWEALRNVDLNVANSGKLFIALYNSQPFASRYWKTVKKIYNQHEIVRPLLVLTYMIYPFLPSMVLRFLQKRKYPRGMSPWYDIFDWLGGYPFEVSTPEQVFNFYKKRGYVLTAMKTVGGRLGCNEYVFQRTTTGEADLRQSFTQLGISSC